jgi:hypothetical protein
MSPPSRNGNGRHSRLATDTDLRANYVAALRRADSNHDFAPLICLGMPHQLTATQHRHGLQCADHEDEKHHWGRLPHLGDEVLIGRCRIALRQALTVWFVSERCVRPRRSTCSPRMLPMER